LWWFGTPSFGYFGKLWMIGFLGENLLSRRRFFIGFKLFLGNCYCPRMLLLHVYFISGV
jgi:hypothetical protein